MERTERSRTGRTDPGSLAAGLAAKLGELESAVHRQAERFAAVIDIGTQISAARDVDGLLQTVVERLSSLVGAEASTLFMHDPRSGELWSRVLKGADLKEIRISKKHGIAGHVFTSGKTLHVADAYEDAHFSPDIDRKTGFRTRSIIAAPLRHVSGKVLGILEVLHRKIDAFTVDDRVLVEGVAAQIAAVLDNVLLVDALRAQSDELAQRVHDLDVLLAAEKAISSADGTTDLIDTLLELSTDALGAGAGSILLIEDEGDSLFFRSARGARSEALKSIRLKSGQGIAGHVASTGEVVRVEDSSDSEFFDRTIPKKLGVSIGSVLCVPISADHTPMGALEILNKPSGFTQHDERLAVLLAGQIGRALVTRKSREEEERKARLASIGQMLAGVLHDLRTPLTVISGYSEMLLSEETAEGRAEMVQFIQTQLEHVAAMQRETLAFARGEKSLLKRKVFMHAFMRDIEEQLRNEFVQSNVELKVDTNYTGAARFDENKMKRAIFNLARNAIDAMPDGGTFTLSLDREKDQLVFRASDNGPGVPEEIVDKLFQSFVTSGKKHGTGLGLAIVKKIADEHDGSVTCKSKTGKGTTFTLSVPAGVAGD